MTLPTSPMPDRILQAIRDRKVRMKSRWRVRIPHVLLLAGLGGLALLLVFLLSFFMYSVYQNGSAFLLLAGWSGAWAFLGTVPWLPLLIGVGVALGFGILVSQQTRAYRFPVAYTLGSVALLLIAGSYAVTRTSMHPAIAGFAANHALPIVQPLYESLPKTETEAAVVGEVQDVQDSSITVQDRQGKTVNVQVKPETSNSPTVPKVKKGDVLIFVEKKQSKTSSQERATNTAEEEDDDAIEYEHVRVPSQKYQQQVRDEIAKKAQELQKELEEKSNVLKGEEEDDDGDRPEERTGEDEDTQPSSSADDRD